MKRSDYHMIIACVFVTPHLNPWVAVVLVTVNILAACWRAAKDD